MQIVNNQEGDVFCEYDNLDILGGTVKGGIAVPFGRLTIGPGAAVVGSIVASNVYISEGACVSGSIKSAYNVENHGVIQEGVDGVKILHNYGVIEKDVFSVSFVRLHQRSLVGGNILADMVCQSVGSIVVGKIETPRMIEVE